MEENDLSSHPVSDSKPNVLAVTSFVTGIAGLPLLCLSVILTPCVFPVGLLAVIAFCTGLLAYYQIKSNGEQGKGMALVGTILGGMQGMFVICSILYNVIGPMIPFSGIQY